MWVCFGNEFKNGTIKGKVYLKKELAVADKLSKCVDINGEDFRSMVLESDIPVMVDFYAQWCGPCRMMSPYLESVASKYDGKIRVVKLNTDDYPRIAMDYDIRALPTVMVFWAGEIAITMTGMRNEKQLIEAAESVLGKVGRFNSRKEGAD